MGRPRKALQLIPTCVGTHEPGNIDCDGDPNAGETSTHRGPCSWRNRCRGFQAHLAESGEDADEHIEVIRLPANLRRQTGLARTAQAKGETTFKDFVRLCEAAWAIHGEEEEPPKERRKTSAQRSGQASGSSPVIRAEPKKANPKHVSAWKQFTPSLDHFERHFKRAATKAGHDFITSTRKIPLPGAITRRDKRKYSRRLYMLKPIKGKDRSIIRLQWKPMSKTVDVFLRSDVNDIKAVVGRKTYMKLNPQPAADGGYKSYIHNADLEALALVADTLGRLLAKGMIKVPGSAP